VTYAQRQRLSYIDHALLTRGVVQRADIVATFDVSMPQASADIAAFIEAHPGIITYDTSARRYVPDGKYRSVTGWTPKRLAAWQAAWEAGVEWAW
jgi:hypothetical protein